MLEFTNKKEQKLIKAITNQFPQLSPLILRGVLAKKDIKVNKKRVKENVDLFIGDKIEIYLPENSMPKIDIFYQDENIIIVNKKAKIEVVSPDKDKVTLTTILSKEQPVFPIHRLDTNTSGLVIFAKNEDSKKELINAFESGLINKFYKAVVVCGKIPKQAVFVDYMQIDKKQGVAKVFDKALVNSLEAKLEYTRLKEKEDLSLLDIKLYTGRTHQIRAQLAFHKIFVLGDGKYGDKNANRKYNKKMQELCAYKLIFKLPKENQLSYLNDLKFEITPTFEKMFD